MIAIVDYGCGNLFSLVSSLSSIGAECRVTSDPAELEAADKIILPGVGAFGDAINKLRESGLASTLLRLAAEGKYILGICLGMQLLFEKSYEYGEHDGLGLIKGDICPLTADVDPKLKVPHMGWNRLILRDNADPLAAACDDDTYVYFVHSFYAKNCEESIIAHSEYGVDVPALVGCGNVFGAQFHPEKSGAAGLKILSAFASLNER